MKHSAMFVACLALFAAPLNAQGRYDCLMEPTQIIELGTAASGLLEEVLVERGDHVEEGQLIALLNSAVEESTIELLETRANSTAVVDAQKRQLEMIERRFERIAAMRERGIATEDRFDTVEGERIAAQSLLMQAELNRDIALKELIRARIALSQRKINSPVSGLVAEILLNAGEYMGTEDSVVRIVRLDPLKVEAFLPVNLYGTIQPGDTAEILPVAPLEGRYVATVKAVDQVFDAASATFVVVLDLPNPDGKLPAGHRCQLVMDEGG